MKPTNDAELLNELTQIEPLRLTHHSWPMGKNILENPPLLNEVVRITKSLGLRLDYNTPEDRAVEFKVAKKLFKDGLSFDVCLKLSPWHVKFAKEDPKIWDISAVEEIQHAHTAFEQSATVAKDEGIFDDVKNIWFNQEIVRGVALADYDDANQEHRYHQRCLDTKNNIMFEMARYYFPHAKVVFHGNKPSWQWTPEDDGSGKGRPYAWKGHHADNYSIALYLNTEETHRRKTFKGLVEYTDRELANPKDSFLYADSDKICIPTVAVGGTRVRAKGLGAPWRWDVDYPLHSDWNLGREINVEYFHAPERIKDYAPWDRAPFCMFWPKLFDTRELAKPTGIHFLAYALGANNIKVDWI